VQKCHIHTSIYKDKHDQGTAIMPADLHACVVTGPAHLPHICVSSPLNIFSKKGVDFLYKMIDRFEYAFPTKMLYSYISNLGFAHYMSLPCHLSCLVKTTNYGTLLNVIFIFLS
jgi:hypothetical protein